MSKRMLLITQENVEGGTSLSSMSNISGKIERGDKQMRTKEKRVGGNQRMHRIKVVDPGQYYGRPLSTFNDSGGGEKNMSKRMADEKRWGQEIYKQAGLKLRKYS